MKVLGINAVYHDPAAALVIASRVIGSHPRPGSILHRLDLAGATR